MLTPPVSKFEIKKKMTVLQDTINRYSNGVI